MNWRVDYRMFRKPREEQEDVFDEAAAFASQLTPEQVIAITPALEKEHVIAVVWHWTSGSFWKCPHCGEAVEDQFETCWHCSTSKPETTTGPTPQLPIPAAESNLTSFAYRLERGSWSEWDDFFADIAKLATSIGPERLVNLAHAGPKHDALATVVYLCEKKLTAESSPHRLTPFQISNLKSTIASRSRTLALGAWCFSGAWTLGSWTFPQKTRHFPNAAFLIPAAQISR